MWLDGHWLLLVGKRMVVPGVRRPDPRGTGSAFRSEVASRDRGWGPLALADPTPPWRLSHQVQDAVEDVGQAELTQWGCLIQ